MNCIFQLIRPLDGFRSEPVACTREVLAARLAANIETHADDLVLVVVENAGTPDQDVSRAPLYRVDSFVRHFHKES